MTGSFEAQGQSSTPKRQTGNNFVDGMAASASARSGSAMGTSYQTPGAVRTKELLPPLDDEKLEGRRKWLYNELSDRGEPMKFSDLLRNLGLSSDFGLFEKDHPKLFLSLAESAPAFVDGVMVKPRKQGAEEPLSSSRLSDKDIIGSGKETAVTSYFQRLVDVMCVEATKQTAEYARSGQTDKSVPALALNLVDHQTSAVADSNGLKMDLVFYNPVASDGVANVHIIVKAKQAATKGQFTVKDFAQIADYQYRVWKAQRTRAFVPVLFLHGSKLDLVVFARDHWYRVGLGPVCYGKQVVRNQDIDDVRLTMARLYYVITQPSESFGHICDVSRGWKHLSFVRDSGVNSMLTTAMSSPDPTTDSVALSGHISRFVHPRGRLAHVFRTKYKGMAAILKLSWTPVDRMPEGAFYEILDKAGVKGVPKVHDSGLLKSNLFGYCLEYLVLEDCGSSIEDYLALRYQGKLDRVELYDSVKRIIQQVLSCLVQVRVKGNILQRDISAGNIMVANDGTVKVIDWGYAKLLEDNSLGGDDNEATRDRKALLETTALRWGYNSAIVTQSGIAHRPLTGTPLYMSIPVLSGATVRGLADDIESLFYVILYVLARLQTTKDDAACGFEANDSKSLAMVRAGCLSDKKSFLRFFGISNCRTELKELLWDLRDFLFINSEGYIAARLIIEPETPRGTAVKLLEPYTDVETMELLSDKGKDMLTPKKSARQIPSIRPPSSLSSDSSSTSPPRKRERSVEQIEEFDEEDPFGPDSKRSKL
ncbi:hypothetical protein GGI17_004064 [Coemansia sp. S146]|nr:hypothetical protein GGI17_004064 [Coemansia sp. S146]